MIDKKKLKTNFVTGDKVMVITGKDKRKIGLVIEITKDKNYVKVENVNLRTHYDKNDGVKTGGLNQKEGWIHVSNISHLTQDNKITKIKRVRDENGKLKIFSKKNNEELRLDRKVVKKVKLDDINLRKEKQEFEKEKFAANENNKKKDDTNVHADAKKKGNK